MQFDLNKTPITGLKCKCIFIKLLYDLHKFKDSSHITMFNSGTNSEKVEDHTVYTNK